MVGHARSPDLFTWEVLPPVTAPGDFAQVETPQLVRVDGQVRTPGFVPRPTTICRSVLRGSGTQGETGTFVFASGEMFGPDVSPGRSHRRVGRAARHPFTPASWSKGSPGKWEFMAFRGDGDRDFLGELIDPLPVTIEPGGTFLVVEYPRVSHRIKR